MKKKNYDVLAENIVSLLGGKENVSFFAHCTTRLRFNVKDRSLVQSKEIEAIENVVGINWSGEQLQIIIGSDVATAYNAICVKHGFEQENAIDENLDKKKFSFNSIIEAISVCVGPVLPLFIATGVLKTILYLLVSFHMLSDTSSTYVVLWGIADAGFYFLPIYVGATSAKRFHTDIGLGMLMGGMVLYPTIANAMNAGESLNIFGLAIPNAAYASTLIPVILSVFILSYVERWFRKITPEVVSALFVPVLALLVMIPIVLFLTGPLGMYAGTLLSDSLMFLYENLGFVTVGFVCAIYPLMVITGMHLAVTPYLVTALATLGFEPLIFVADFMHNFSEGAACLAVSIKTKNKKLKTISSTCAINATVAGISEPAIYGVTLRYKTPMIAVVIGNLIGGLVAGLLHVKIYGFAGTLGIFGLPLFHHPGSNDFIFMILAIIFAMIATFITTLIMYKDTDEMKGEIE